MLVRVPLRWILLALTAPIIVMWEFRDDVKFMVMMAGISSLLGAAAALSASLKSKKTPLAVLAALLCVLALVSEPVFVAPTRGTLALHLAVLAASCLLIAGIYLWAYRRSRDEQQRRI
jgi:peptidoglycan/LPS O-acetylase OafA/YrhL